MFTPLHKQRSALALVIVIAILGISSVFSHLSIAQTSTTGVEEIKNATLRAEYFLPIQAQTPVEENKIVIGANECEQIFASGSVSTTNTRPVLTGTSAQLACSETKIDETLGFAPDLSDAGETVIARKTTSGLEMVKGNVTVSYPFILSDSQTFALRLSAFDAGDAFGALTREEYSSLVIPSSYDYPNFPQMIGTNRATSTNTELSVRAMLFQVALDTPTNVIGVVSVLDSKQINNAIINLGVVSAGEHKLYITFANDLTATLAEKTLEKRPVLSGVELLTTVRTNDVMGVRVYSNPNNLPADVWYAQNLTTPGVPVPFEVDGFGGVIDGRTSYINAANVAFDATSGNSRMYTNIYVIAHNVNASSQTIEIFSRILSNWKFNKNIIENEDDATQEAVKNKLRRDVRRLEDLYRIRQVIEQYKTANGKYPTLDAGTYDPGHAVSTWPTWQSVLGNELGSLLPLDPINTMSREFYPNGSALSQPARQYDCTDSYESTFCKNICTRDTNNNPATGCPSNQQCVSDQYCSLVPADVTVGSTTFKGFDALTGWSEEAQRLYFNVLASNEGRHTIAGNKLSGYNTGGAVNNFNDDAFVYQYTALDGGQSYALNYRFEYQAYCLERRLDGSCKVISNNLCGPGACYIDGVGAAAGRCIDSGSSPYTNGTATNAEYKNIYCFAGQLVNSCGNGILQADAGEVCEFNDDFGQAGFCDARYGTQQWYNENNVSESCTASCQLATVANENDIPLAYNPQAPGLSCGGYCGDGRTQFEFSEQCDAGFAGGELKRPAQGGSAGVSADSQYFCTGSNNFDIATSSLANIVGDGSFESNQVSYQTTPLTIADREKTSWTGILANNAPTVAYQNTQINQVSIINQGRSGDKALVLKGATDADVLVAQMAREAVGSVTYAVSVQARNLTPKTTSDAPANIVVRIEELNTDGVVVKTTQTTQAMDASYNEWKVVTTNHSMTPTGKFVRVTLQATGVASGVLFDEVSMIAKQACQTFGGYCGDGIIQSASNEQCDIESFIPPTPRRSVDQLANGGFEQGFGGWFVVTDSGVDTSTPLNADSLSYEIRNSRAVGVNDYEIGAGFSALAFDINKDVTKKGVGQQVTFPARGNNNLPTQFTVSLRARLGENSIKPMKAKLRLYQYNFADGTNTGFEESATLEYKEFDFTSTQSSDLEKVQIDGEYKTFKASATLPATTSTNINQATILSIVFDCFNTSDCPEITTLNPDYPERKNSGIHTVLIDEVQIINSTYNLQYACSAQSTSLCQLGGGYCGDGVTQSNFGESCDLGSANGSIDGVDGNVCSKYCSAPYCGDGILGMMIDDAGNAKKELCDASAAGSVNAQYCNESCSRFLPGASCEVNSQCSTGVCSGGICIEKFGEQRCDAGDSTCPLGFSCDLSSNICRPELDTYLRYHLDGAGYGIPYFNSESRILCPDLKKVTGTNSYKDNCTGLTFTLKTTNTLSYSSAENVCNVDGFRLPTAKQLLSLVVVNEPRTFNTDTSKLPRWPYTFSANGILKDAYADSTKFTNLLAKNLSGNASGTLTSTKDDRFVFWSSTGSDSSKAVVDFKRGSVDYVNPAPTDTKFLSLCVLDTTCGDGKIAGLEQCDFDEDGLEFFSASNSCAAAFDSQEFKDAGIDRKGRTVVGKSHCDVNTCRLRYDNCAIVSEPVPKTAPTRVDSCNAVCNEVFGSNVFARSVGTNLVEQYSGRSPSNAADKNRLRDADIKLQSTDSFISGYSVNGVEFNVANDGKYIDKDGNLVTVPEVDGTQLKFSLSGLLAGDISSGKSIGFERGTLDVNVAIETISNMVGGISSTTPYTTGFSPALSPANNNSITAPAFMCACNFSAPVQSTTGLSGIDDEAFIQEYFRAQDLVATAESLVGTVPQFSAAVQSAQTAITGLYTLASGKGNVYIKPVDELQARLFIVAEIAVTQVETSQNQATEKYSEWKFDESAYRIARNTGIGRSNLASGGGADITFKSCVGPTCTANLTWYNNDLTDTGGVRKTLELNGDDYGTTTGAYLNPNAFTFMGWVRPNALDATNPNDSIAGTIWSFYEGATSLQLALTNSGNIQLDVVGTSCTESLSTTNTLGFTTWAHVAVVYNGTEYQLYVDGAPATSKASACKVSVSPQSVMYIGGSLNGQNPVGSLDARIDTMYLYDTAKTDIQAEKVKSIYITAQARTGFIAKAVNAIKELVYTIKELL